MGAKDKEPDGIGAIALQCLLNCDQIAQRFAHLLLAELHQPVVQPVPGKGANASEGLRLGDLVLMVGEDEVLPAAVNIDSLAQVFQGHGAALDVPAGPPWAPGAFPLRLAGLGRLPKGEVHRMLLFVPAFLHPACFGRQVAEVSVAELTVFGKAGYTEIDIAPRLIGVTLLDQACNDLDDFGDFLSRPGVNVGSFHV